VTTTPGTPILEAREIVKTYGHVQALRGARFTAYPGEVVALIGDNGAGKSTLTKILAGVAMPDSGDLLFEGRPVQIRHRQRRRRSESRRLPGSVAGRGSRRRRQHLLGREIIRPGLLGHLGVLDKRAMRRQAAGRVRRAGRGDQGRRRAGRPTSRAASARASPWRGPPPGPAA